MDIKVKLIEIDTTDGTCSHHENVKFNINDKHIKVIVSDKEFYFYLINEVIKFHTIME